MDLAVLTHSPPAANSHPDTVAARARRAGWPDAVHTTCHYPLSLSLSLSLSLPRRNDLPTHRARLTYLAYRVRLRYYLDFFLPSVLPSFLPSTFSSHFPQRRRDDDEILS